MIIRGTGIAILALATVVVFKYDKVLTGFVLAVIGAALAAI